MIRSLLLALSLTLVPSVAMADEVTPSSTPTSALTPQGATTINGSVLQPAQGSGQSSTTNSLGASGESGLQAAPASLEATQAFLAGEGEGKSQSLDEDGGSFSWLDGLAVVILFVLALGGYLLRRRQLRLAHARYPRRDE